MEDIAIIYPWVIVHQPKSRSETILAGPPDATERHFAIIAADLIRHIGRAYQMDEKDVLKLVQEEMDNPTSAALGVPLHHHSLGGDDG